MIQHESNDPRNSEGEAAERSRQARLTRRLVLAISFLLGVIAVVAGRQYGFF